MKFEEDERKILFRLKVLGLDIGLKGLGNNGLKDLGYGWVFWVDLIFLISLINY